MAEKEGVTVDELAKMTDDQEQESKLNAALAELSSAIISPVTTLDEICQLVLNKARLLTASQQGFVSSIDPKTCAHISNTLTEMRAKGCTVEAALYALPNEPHHLYHGLWGHSLNTGEAFFTNSPAAHPAAQGLPDGHLPLKNFLSVPVSFGGRLMGQIALANSPQDYTEADLKIAKRLGELYAVVLYNRQQEQELRRSEERFRQMVEGAPLPLVVTRLADHTIVYINQLAAELFGVAPQEAIGRKAPEFHVSPEDRLKLIGEVLKKGRVLDRELPLKTHQGKVFWGILSVTKMEWFGDSVIMVAINNISARKQMEEELQRLATIDSLTGLLNRRQFLALGDKEIKRSRRYARPLSLIIYDIDHFKAVNDTYGHQAGDMVLKQLAQTAQLQLRGVDIAGRVGGEEFGIILPETKAAAAVQVAERIRTAIENGAIEFAGTPLKVTASFGVTENQEDQMMDPIFKRADDALYMAKTTGRNRVILK